MNMIKIMLILILLYVVIKFAQKIIRKIINKVIFYPPYLDEQNHDDIIKYKDVEMLLIRPIKDTKKVLIYSHGNACDIRGMKNRLKDISEQISDINIIAYEYPGYGNTEGTPNENDIYINMFKSIEFAKEKFNSSNEDIFLYGLSIGTGPTVEIASRKKYGGIILESPFTSIIRIEFGYFTFFTRYFDVFLSIEKIHKIKSPILIIHGKDDSLIDYHHSIQLHENNKKSKLILEENSGHGDTSVNMGKRFIFELKKIINK